MLTINAIPAKTIAFPVQKQFKISGFNFVQTSKSYPESYNIFDRNGNQVGYVSLRWGCLSCRYPNINGERIYESFFESEYLGEFEYDELRQIFLEDIANALTAQIYGIKYAHHQKFECVKWFQKYGFTFTNKGDMCGLIGTTDNGLWIVKTENGAVQMIEDRKFREHFEAKIVVENAIVICA